MLKVNIIPCLRDNYSYIIEDTSTNTVGAIDPSEFKPIDNFIKKKFNKIDFIMNTHHHFDHTGGNLELKKKYNCKIMFQKHQFGKLFMYIFFSPYKLIVGVYTNFSFL